MSLEKSRKIKGNVEYQKDKTVDKYRTCGQLQKIRKIDFQFDYCIISFTTKNKMLFFRIQYINKKIFVGDEKYDR